MAKCVLTFTDGDDDDTVSLSGDLGEENAKVTPAIAMTMAVHKLFESQWLAKNLGNIVPELFIKKEEPNEK